MLLSKLVGLTSGEDKHTPLAELVLKIISEHYTISAAEVQKLTPEVDPTSYIFLCIYFNIKKYIILYYIIYNFISVLFHFIILLLLFYLSLTGALALKQCLLLTIYFIATHVRFSSTHSTMNLAFAKWIEFNAIHRWVHTKTDFSEEVIRALSASFDSDDAVNQIIEHATTVDIPADLWQGTPPSFSFLQND